MAAIVRSFFKFAFLLSKTTVFSLKTGIFWFFAVFGGIGVLAMKSEACSGEAKESSRGQALSAAPGENGKLNLPRRGNGKR
jgi:hypothetical protein